MEVTVCDMRGAGKAGYVAKILQNREKSFLAVKSYESHGHSAKNVTYDIKHDGIYEICDANFGGRKRNISFVLVKDGTIAFESESLRDVEDTESGVEDWAVGAWSDRPSEISNHAIGAVAKKVEEPKAAVVETESRDVEIRTLKIDGITKIIAKMHSDAAFNFFIPALKNRVPERKYNPQYKIWEVTKDNALFLREVVEEYTTRTNGIRHPLVITISPNAKTLMAID